MKPRVGPVLIAPLLIAACSPPARAVAHVQKRHGLRRELLGCYAIVGKAGASVGKLVFHPPTVAQLESTSVGEDEWRLTPDGAPPQGVPNMTAWSADSSTDTVRLSFSDGLTGTDFILAARGDTWPGRAVAFGDAGPAEWAEGPVTAHRISCAASGGEQAAPGAPAT